MRPLMTAVLLLAAAAPLPAQERHGFWFNGGLGYGSLGCDNCGSREGGLSGGLSLGGTVSPKLLLGVGTTGWTRNENGVTLTSGTLDARIRFYPSRTGGFFLTGGLGVGTIHVSVDGFGSDTQTGFGAVLGLGYDIRVGSGLSLTPFWNGFAVRNNSSDVNVGQIGLSLTVHKFREPERAPPTSVPAPAPAPAKLASPPTPAAPATDVPPPSAPAAVEGGEATAPFVGDTRLKLYYPSTCAARKNIPPQFRVLFQSAAGAQRDGFRRSGDCD
jgi:outer membrane protein with beta-barrel domain